MPMMRDTPPPLPADVLRDLRATLSPSFGHKLVNHEGHQVLAIHVPGDVPDRERDIVRASDYIPEEEVSVARDILLIGAEKMIRLDAVPLRDAVRERLRDDAPTSKEARRTLDRNYGASLFNPAAKPRDLCLAVRIPRASIHEATPEDLTAAQEALQPILAQPQATRTAMCYIIADNDFRRGPPEEFARVLRGEVPLRPPRINNYVTAGDSRSGARMAVASSFSGSPFGMLVTQAAAQDAKMEANKARKTGAPPPAPTPAAPAPPPTPAPAPRAPEGLAGLLHSSTPTPPAPAPARAPPAAPAPAPAARTSTIIDAEEPIVRAVSAPAPAPPATFADPVVHIGTQLTGLGFEVITDVRDMGIHLAAHKEGGKRLIVQRTPEATPTAVQGLAKLCGELEADAGILVADTVAPGTWLEAAGSKVEVLPTNTVQGWAL